MTIQPRTRRYAITPGRNVFQVRLIKRSYRIRGRVPRTQINVNAINSVFKAKKSLLIMGILNEEEKSATVNMLIARMLVYSAIKISAKGPLLYSVLNPETSSDSPSAWSNGVRFVSARIVTNQIKNIGVISNQALERVKNEGDMRLYL